ncbi:MAG: peptidylprolyl isomerase [Oscillospiraceae bacterium]|nr:peptidylprolyl isomerase [Oscillospiraceae bacterium]
MKRIKKILPLFLICVILAGCKGKDSATGNMEEIRPPQTGDVYAEITFRDFDGKLTFVLFEDIAPVGVKEFIESAENGYYDGKTFHRVLKDALVQGGALNIDGSDPATIPEKELFEIETHKNARNFNGALCYATHEKSGMNYKQFYIVTASKSIDIDEEVAKIDEFLENPASEILPQNERREYEQRRKALSGMSKAAKERYSQIGGIPSLDGNVTVFGQLITGQELLEEISKVEVIAGNKLDDYNTALGNGDGQFSRPAEEIYIEKVEIIRYEAESTRQSRR